MSTMWKNIKLWSGWSKPEQDLAKSTYSLVSSEELTADTLRLWLSLPEEVKNDPALEPLRLQYEKENGNLKSIPLDPKHTKIKSRLPFVKSAPSLKVPDTEFDVNNGETEKDFNDIKNGSRDSTIQEPTVNTSDNNFKRNKMAQAKYLIKMTLLLGCWVFFTAVFIMYEEKIHVLKNTAIISGEVKNYTLQNPSNELSILITLSGPFLTEDEEIRLNDSQLEKQPKIQVWVERWLENGNNDAIIDKEATQPWTIYLLDQSKIDFNDGEPRSSKFSLPAADSNHSYEYAIQMNTTSTQITPFTLSYFLNPLDIGTGVVYAVLLLIGLYVLIIFEVINRTMGAIVVSTLSLAALSLAGERPSVPEIISWLDIETLVLLFSMMILVAIVAETGIFDFLAVYTFEVTKGKLWPLIFILCTITAVLSTFLDNVTTVLLMSPVTIRLCEVMDLDPVPILMFMAIYSNIGGTATPVGDPPCVIVASNKAVIKAGINFTNFTAHMSLGIILVLVQTSLQLRFMFRDTNKLRLNVPRDIQDLRQQIAIRRRAAESLSHLSKDVHLLRESLEKSVRKLSAQLQTLVRQSHKRACPKETYQSTLNELKDKYKIRNVVLLAKSSFAICFVVVLFFLHSIPEFNRVSLGWTALLGAILLLILADREDIEPILHRVEWSTLLFFAALFVLMEALSKLGLIQYVGSLMEQLILKVDESARLAVAIVLILWVSGVISAFVDNIPLTTMMVRVVVAIGSNPYLNLPMGPLIWALLFGACLGGNGTLIAASANVVCAGVAEQHGYKFTFMRFFKVGFPVMIGGHIVSTIYLLICHCVFTWH